MTLRRCQNDAGPRQTVDTEIDKRAERGTHNDKGVSIGKLGGSALAGGVGRLRREPHGGAVRAGDRNLNRREAQRFADIARNGRPERHPVADVHAG